MAPNTRKNKPVNSAMATGFSATVFQRSSTVDGRRESGRPELSKLYGTPQSSNASWVDGAPGFSVKKTPEVPNRTAREMLALRRLEAEAGEPSTCCPTTWIDRNNARYVGLNCRNASACCLPRAPFKTSSSTTLYSASGMLARALTRYGCNINRTLLCKSTVWRW